MTKMTPFHKRINDLVINSNMVSMFPCKPSCGQVGSSYHVFKAVVCLGDGRAAESVGLYDISTSQQVLL